MKKIPRKYESHATIGYCVAILALYLVGIFYFISAVQTLLPFSDFVDVMISWGAVVIIGNVMNEIVTIGYIYLTLITVDLNKWDVAHYEKRLIQNKRRLFWKRWGKMPKIWKRKIKNALNMQEVDV